MEQAIEILTGEEKQEVFDVNVEKLMKHKSHNIALKEPYRNDTYYCVNCHHVGKLNEDEMPTHYHLRVGEVMVNDEKVEVEQYQFKCENCGNTHFSNNGQLYLHNLYCEETEEAFHIRSYGYLYQVYEVLRSEENPAETRIYTRAVSLLEEYNSSPNPKINFEEGYGHLHLGAKDVRLAIKMNKKTKKVTVVSKGDEKFIRIINYGKGIDAGHVYSVLSLVPETFIAKMVENLKEGLHPKVVEEWVGDKENIRDKFYTLMQIAYMPSLAFAGREMNMYATELTPYTRTKMRKATSQLEFFRSLIPSITPKGVKELLKHDINPRADYRYGGYWYSTYPLSMLSNGDYVRNILSGAITKSIRGETPLIVFQTKIKNMKGEPVSRTEGLKRLRNYIPADKLDEAIYTVVKTSNYDNMANWLEDTIKMDMSLDDAYVQLKTFIQKHKEHQLVPQLQSQLESIQEFKARQYQSLRRLHDDIAKLQAKVATKIELIDYTKDEHERFEYVAKNEGVQDYSFTLPEGTNVLVEVGQQMNICVGSYGYGAVKKNFTIVIVRDEADYPVLCLEIRQNGFAQVKKRFNKTLSIAREADLPLIAAMAEYTKKTRLNHNWSDLDSTYINVYLDNYDEKKESSLEFFKGLRKALIEADEISAINASSEREPIMNVFGEDPFANPNIQPIGEFDELPF